MRPNILHLQDSEISISYGDIIQLVLLMFGLIFEICSVGVRFLKVRYVSFDIDLSTLQKSTLEKRIDPHFYTILLGILLTETRYDINIAMLFNIPINFYSFVTMMLNLMKFLTGVHPFLFSLCQLASAVCPTSHVVCLFITFITCTLITRKVPLWVTFLLILLSNDIEMNPGPPYHENFFTFMN